jgi:sn1-specific diacylglycerol lipase
MWADPKTCCTVRSSGLPAGRRVSVYCFAPPYLSFFSVTCVVLISLILHRCLVDPALSALASNLITSLVYSHDVVSRLSLGSVKDIRNAAMWLCAANDEEQGYDSVTRKARAWKAGEGNFGTPDWVRHVQEPHVHRVLTPSVSYSSSPCAKHLKRTCT